MFFQTFLPYWRNESSGKLAKAVERYFAFGYGEDPLPLTDSELIILRTYLSAWINYPWEGFDRDLRKLQDKFENAETFEELQQCMDIAASFGIDPF